jgi:pimeloyl-ACP methyl ester carboxylesterase
MTAATPKGAPRTSEAAGHNAFLFVPGFKGSILRDARTNKVAWLTAWGATVGRRTLELSRPIGEESLVSSGLLDYVYLGRPFRLDCYGDTVANIEASLPKGSTCACIHYDWRRGVPHAARMLENAVRDHRSRGASRIHLIAHSMGGLAVAYFLRYGAQPLAEAQETWEGAGLVDSVLLAGVPFGGAAVMFRDFQRGVRAGLNTSLLSVAALSSFESTYQLLPRPGAQVLTCDDAHVEPLDIYDAECWRSNGWGPFRGVRDERDATLWFDFVERQLSIAACLDDLLHRQPIRMPPRQCKLGNLYSASCATLNAVRMVADGKRVRCAPRQSGNVFAAGDATVTSRSARLPASYRESFECFESELPGAHGTLLKTPESARAISAFFGMGRERMAGDGLK